MRLRFWLRWATRDLRQRWLQVLAIAAILALGTGMYAGLGGQEAWRIASLDASYAALRMYDLRLVATPGSFLDVEGARRAFAAVPGVRSVEPRLVLDTQLEVAGREGEVRVAARILGVDTDARAPGLNAVALEDGRGLGPDDHRHALLEVKFARHHGVERGARLRFAGGLEVEVVGTGHVPEHFLVMPPGSLFAFVAGEASFGVVTLPLAAAQEHGGRPGQANEVLFEIERGADASVVGGALERTAAEAFPGVAVNVSARSDDPVHHLLYADAVEDQVMLDFFAWILLAGAAFAAFNLAGRVVESQRRQIGIGMALGLPRPWIALRPVLMGLQMALIGTLLGLATGYAFAWLLGGVFEEMMPLPVWSGTLLHAPSFLAAAGLGVLLPVLATLVPVWRAVRSPPLDALHGHLAPRDSGLNRALKGLRLPGTTIAQMPWKNVLRSARRSGLTALGIAVAAILLTLFLGIQDTLAGTLGQVERALLHRGEERVTVTLGGFARSDHPQIDRLRALARDDGRPLIGALETGLLLPAELRAVGGEARLDVALEFVDPASAIWTPTVTTGALLPPAGAGELPGVVVARKLAEDLGLQVGSPAVLMHPQRLAPLLVRRAETRVVISGLHDNPVRALADVGRGQRPFTGFEDTANVLTALPAAGVDHATLRRALFDQPGIAAATPVRQVIAGLDEVTELFDGVIGVVRLAVLVLAFLIAFNATAINVDDRGREIATLFAFGLRPRTVLWLQMGENLLLGLLGAALGLLVGIPLLQYFMAVRMEDMLAEIGLLVSVAPATVVTIVLLTAGVVALTPLVMWGRLRRIDVPSTLRVME